MLENKPSLEQSTETITTVLKALSDPTRLRIFEALMRGASCNGWLTEELDLSANLLSHHLKVLRDTGLIQDRRDAVDGRWIYYQVNLTMLTQLHQWSTQFFNPARAVLSLNMCGPEGQTLGPNKHAPQLIIEETVV